MLQVLAKMDYYMHKKNMRVKDLFSKSGFDKSGDGMLDVDEFCMALELLGVQFSKKETRVLVQFLDESGDGEIEAYELENALRRLRKGVAVLKEAREAAKEEEASRGEDSSQNMPNKSSPDGKVRVRKRGGTALAHDAPSLRTAAAHVTTKEDRRLRRATRDVRAQRRPA